MQGVLAVIAAMPGPALLLDEAGRVLAGSLTQGDAQAGDADRDGVPLLGIGAVTDILGTDQVSVRAIELEGGRRMGVSCRRFGGGGMPGPFILVQEDRSQRIAGRFAAVHQGMLRDEREVSRAKQAEQKMREEASHWRILSMTDRMTGLLNSTGFREQAAECLASLDDAVLLYADLNGFKQVNDLLGHSAGDRLLCDIATSVRGAIRSGDLAGRLGGDEFAILLPGCPPEELENVTARVRKAMSRRFPVDRGEGEVLILSVTPAIGTASLPRDGRAIDLLIAAADARMYDEKTAQRGTVLRTG